MEYDEGDEHSDIYAHTIFVFNVVLMAIVASLGIVGNGLVLTLLHDCNVYMNTSQNIIGKIFDALIIKCINNINVFHGLYNDLSQLYLIDSSGYKKRRAKTSFYASTSTQMHIYIHGMAFADIGYLICSTFLIYYSSEMAGFGYQEGKDEIFLAVLPTCNAFKGKS